MTCHLDQGELGKIHEFKVISVIDLSQMRADVSWYEAAKFKTVGIRDLTPNYVPALTRISQMTPFALACNLRHTLENKEFDAFHAKVTGEPSG